MGISSFKFAFVYIVLVFSIMILSTASLASISLNVSSTPVVQSSVAAGTPSSSVMITGSIVNTTPTDNVTFINVSATIGSNLSSILTPNSGTFSFNATTPTAAGEYTLNVSTNSSSLPSKIFTVFVSNSSSGSISFIGGKTPPFTNGTTFTINVTLNNGTSLLGNYTPNVKIYQANGKNISWTVTNVGPTQTNNTNGSVAYNITVPADASAGEYGISVDFGRAFIIFSVGSTFQMAVNTLTSSDEVTPTFSPGSTVTILSKLRANGNPVTGATVTAVITYPNGTTTKNITLSARPSSEGFYNNTFATESGVRGTYTVKVGALASGSDVTASTTLGTSTFTGRIEPVKNAFFFEWGGKSAFKPGESISLNLVTINLTNGDAINWGSCTGGNYTFISITYVNGTNTTLGNASATLSTDQYLPSINVCKATFKAPTDSGTYNIKYNATLGDETKTLDGFFSVSNHFLKVTPVLDLGGFEGFQSVFAPGNNITLTLKAINVSGNVEVNKQNITAHTVTKIVPLEFISGSSEVTTIAQTSYNGVNSVVDPNISFVLPSTVLGPVLIEVTATVNSSAGTSFISEKVTGTAFIISNYLSGFLGPQKGGALPSHEGEGTGGFNADAHCAGTQTFSGIVTDVNTSTAAQGAAIVGISQAREEETGKSVAGFLSIAGTTASDSSGTLSANVTFSPTGGYSFSGNYFVIFNATYKGKFAGVPAFFMCRALNMGSPQIRVLGSNQQFSWQVSPTSALNVTVTNVANMSGTLINSTGAFSSMFSITQIFNFNPSSGTMQILTNNTPMSVNFTAVPGTNANNASLMVYPQNYSLNGVALAKWPNGFFDIRPRVASNLGTDTGFGGFMVVAFDAFPEFAFGQQYIAGSNQSIIVRAATNVSNFTVTMGRPWEGVLQNAGNVSAAMLSDGWNASTDTGNFSSYSQSNTGGPYERWNVSFTVPNGLRKGGTMLSVKAVSNATGLDGESVEVPLFVSITKFNVVLPWEEGVGQPSSSQMDEYSVPADGGMWPNSAFGAELQQRNASSHGWNMGWINSTYGINSTSGRVCVKDTFNSTRYTQGGQQQNIGINTTSGSTRILVIDRWPSSSYDTVILNRSNETVVLNSTSAATRAIGGQTYLWDIKDCSFFTIVNASTNAIQAQGGGFISNNNGGSHQAGTNFTVPYVVISGGARQNGVPVSIKSLAKQDNRGFGFEGKLTQAYYTKNGQYNTTDITTNSDGLAFVTLQVSTSGKLLAFWSTTLGSEGDTADMSTATTAEIKGFSTSAQSITPLTSGVVTLVNDTNNRTQLVTGSPKKWIFNGTITETTDGNFVSNGVADPWSIVYDGSSNRILVVNTSNAYFLGGNIAFDFDSVTGSLKSFYNVTITPTVNVSAAVTSIGNNIQLKIGEWINGTASNNYTKIALFYTYASGSPSRYTVTTATENVTALICAEGFERPTAIPVENATINVSVTDWSSFPPAVKYLDMFKLSDGSRASQANPIVTSPAGCALVRIGPGQLGSWPSASAGNPPVFIEGTVTKTSGSSEFAYVGDVFRQ